MSSPITLRNFNRIDFGVILNAVMEQASQPMLALQDKQSDLAATNSAHALPAGKLGSVETAAAGLSTSAVVTPYPSTFSDTGQISVATTGTAAPDGANTPLKSQSGTLSNMSLSESR